MIKIRDEASFIDEEINKQLEDLEMKLHFHLDVESCKRNISTEERLTIEEEVKW